MRYGSGRGHRRGRGPGVAVHDRYPVYDKAEHFGAGVRHQLCCSHILRDLADAAESYPDAVWPTQCARALRGLIHSANIVRGAGHTQVEARLRERLVGEFGQGVQVGLKDIRRQGGPNDKQLPALLVSPARVKTSAGHPRAGVKVRHRG